MGIPYQFKSMDDLVGYLQDLEKRVDNLEMENAELRGQVHAVDGRSLDVISFVKDHWPKTGLVNPSFIIRSLTVYGHFFVIQLAVSLVLGAIYFIVIAPLISSALQNFLPQTP
jgi:hypothetical protein